MFADQQSLEYPSKDKIPFINIPPIVYSNESRVDGNGLSTNNNNNNNNTNTKDIPPSSSFDQFMKSVQSAITFEDKSSSVIPRTPMLLRSVGVLPILPSSMKEETVHKPVAKRTAFVPINKNEFGAVPYDSTRNADFVKISGMQDPEGNMFYTKPANNQKQRTIKSRENANDDHANTNDKKTLVKDTDDYIFHMYVGSLSVIGLLILFRIIQKS